MEKFNGVPPEELGIEILGFCVPYEILGVTGYEEQDLTDADQFTTQQIEVLEKEGVIFEDKLK